jgi:hypothetical protein
MSLPLVLSRRDLLIRSGLAGLGLGVRQVAAAAPPPASPHVRRYSPLGSTGLGISDISFGASRLGEDENLVRHAFDLGINYFDSAETYTGGVSETTIGKALAGKRDRVFLTSKTITTAATRREEMMRALEGSLRRLRTDHVDVYFTHAVNDVERLRNPEWNEFVAAAKKQGKIRFSGMSGHAGRLIPCLDYAIDNRSVDVVLTAYNFGQDPRFYQRYLQSFDFVALQPELPRLLAKARGAGIGTIAMKTLMGARLNDMRRYESRGATFAQAAFRWVLSNSDVDALIVSMTSRAMVEEYLAASGARAVAEHDAPLLLRYAAARSRSFCRFGCDACAGSCPSDVPIADVLRARMYAHDYQDPALARDEYLRLGAAAAACASCSARSCTSRCPFGLPVAELTRDTHHLLG